jgi:predicted nucleic acid-binding protein
VIFLDTGFLFALVYFVIMDRLGIREALSVDGDVAHRFVALPGPLPK